MAAPLFAFLPVAWRSDCFGGESFIDGAGADLTCQSPAAGVDLLSLIAYDGSDPTAADGEYGNNFYQDGDPTCPQRSRLDGDLVVGGRTIGSAGGCRGQDWFAFVLDDEQISGRISAASFQEATAAFVRYRPFPDGYRGVIEGPAFAPLASFADLRASARRPTYEAVVHNSDAFQGDRVFYRGEVQQYTRDPNAPFTVLVWVKQDSGTFIGGPLGLGGYAGRPLSPGDEIDLVGRVGPLVTYDSVGGSRTIPTIDVERVRLAD